MTVFAVVVLLVSAVFTVVAWPRFLQRVGNDPRARDESGRRTRFYTVHLVLVILAVAIAVASVAAAIGLLLA